MFATDSIPKTNEDHPSLAEQTGLAYIPMLSQRRSPSPEEHDTEKTSVLERLNLVAELLPVKSF